MTFHLSLYRVGTESVCWLKKYSSRTSFLWFLEHIFTVKMYFPHISLNEEKITEKLLTTTLIASVFWNAFDVSVSVYYVYYIYKRLDIKPFS